MTPKYLGVCTQCNLPCHHEFISSRDMEQLTSRSIDNLESGCKHFQGLEICENCRKEMVSHIWRLAKGENETSVEVG